MKTLTTLLVIGLFATAFTIADDVDDVKAASLSYFAALSAGDAEGFVRHLVPEYSSFAPGGGLLNRATSLEEQKRNRQAAIDSGQKLNLQLRHREVKVYGNAAIVTGYVTGSVTNSDGTVNPVSWRRTSVWIKQGGQWKQAHHHRSNMGLPQ